MGTHQILAYSGDINLLCENINHVKKNIEVLLDASNESGVGRNAEKAKYVIMPSFVRENHIVKIVKFFENVVELKYLGMTVTNQNYNRKENKSILNSRNACNHSVQNLLYSHSVSRNVRVEIYKIITLAIALCGCEAGENCIMRNFLIGVLHEILLE
jgi:hypothetical protein